VYAAHEQKLRFHGMSGTTVAEGLDRAIARHDEPRTIAVNHGTGFMSPAPDDWACRRGITLDFIPPGKPTQVGFLGAFNGKLRDRYLNVRQFPSLGDARSRIEAWRGGYNN